MIRIKQTGKNVRENHILAVLECICNYNEVSTNELVERVNVSSATVSRIINYLKNEKVVVVGSKVSTDLGRKPELYELNSDFGYMLHYEFAEGQFVGFLTNLVGEIKTSSSIPVPEDLTLAEIKGLLLQLKNQFSDELNIESDKILACGISLPGVVNEEQPTIERIPNIYNLQRINVKQAAKEALNLDVIINNDSRLATIGEKIMCYPKSKSFVFINFTKGYGVGGGIIINGELYKGNRGAAGEIGDMFFDQSNFLSDYRENMGCMESYSGLESMYKRLQRTIDRGFAQQLKEELDKSPTKQINLNIIERAIKNNDSDVAEILDSTIKIWSTSIINIYALIDPELIVLGGAINSSNSHILEKIEHNVSKGLYFKPDIRLSTLGFKAQTYGGVHMLKQYVYNNILSKIVLCSC